MEAIFSPDLRQVAQEIITLLDPQRCCNGPHVVICWDESQSLFEPVRDAVWTRFSELRHVLGIIKPLSFISVFLSTTASFHYTPPSPEYGPSMRLMSEEVRMLPPITEVGFDQFAEKVSFIKDDKGEWSLRRIASTYQIVHLGRAL